MRINKINLFSIKPTVFKGTETKPAFGTPKEDEFVRATGSVDIARLKDLNIAHFRLIDSNSVRGVTLANQSPEILKELRECGINTVIDLRSEAKQDSKYETSCKDNGLNYLNFKLKINMPIFNPPLSCKLNSEEREEANKKFIEGLPEFFRILDEGRYYMACLLGLHRTDLAVTLNYLINPKEPISPPILSHMYMDNETNFTNKYIGAMKNLLKNIKPEARELLKLPENFIEIFYARVMKLRMMNGMKKI